MKNLQGIKGNDCFWEIFSTGVDNFQGPFDGNSPKYFSSHIFVPLFHTGWLLCIRENACRKDLLA